MFLGVNVSLVGRLRSGTAAPAFSPASLFASGEEGAWYEPSPTTCFTDASGTVAATYGDAVQYLQDLSGNGNHATQVTAGARPILARVPEGGRRNLLERTEEFDDAYWTKVRIDAFGSGSVANTTATTDPLGGNTAEYIKSNSTTFGGVFSSETFASGTSRTLSVYAKAAEASFVVLVTGNGTLRTWFDLSGSGAVGTTSATHTPHIEGVGNGWFRCSVTTTDENPRNIYIGEANGSITTTVGNGIYIWGAQLEVTA